MTASTHRPNSNCGGMRPPGARVAPTQIVCVGFSLWKRPIARRYFDGTGTRVRFASPRAALDLIRKEASAVCVWGISDPPGFEQQTRAAGANFVRMEDGFVRSVGLGSDFVLPSSICVDRTGIYYDYHRPSDLERLLATHHFSNEERERARRLREAMVALGLTKYNLAADRVVNVRKLAAGRPVILVPGQVPGDASLLRGTASVRTNLGLLRSVRAEHPKAFIVYKEHPDVTSGNRGGRSERPGAAAIADLVVTRGSILSWIAACDEVHVLTSLAGFEALIREKPVTCWGMPFFAGWGFTRDRIVARRRGRILMLDGSSQELC